MVAVSRRLGACTLLALLAACGGGSSDTGMHTVSVTMAGAK